MLCGVVGYKLSLCELCCKFGFLYISGHALQVRFVGVIARLFCKLSL